LSADTEIHVKQQQPHDDHALEAAPTHARRSWLKLSWNTVGIVTTLVALYIGALLTFVAGVRLALAGGLIVACMASALGWAVGHVAYSTGMPSGLLARHHGFGVQGSIVMSSVFGFMMIGFLAAENVLLYEVILLLFDAPDDWTMRFCIYGAFTAIWSLLTAYGFNTVSRFSSLMVVAFLTTLAYLLLSVVDRTQQSWVTVTTFGTQLPATRLTELGIVSERDKLVFCINVLAGSGGALALLTADLGRYAKRSIDVGVAVGLGAVACCMGMVLAGGMIMYASVPLLADGMVSAGLAAQEEAVRLASSSPEKVAAAFILIGGVFGAVLVVAAQSKAQVINSYSSSLSLTNIFDSLFRWRPGRVVFVVLANLLSLALLGGEFLSWFNTFLETLGILTTCFAAVIVADYFFVRRYEIATRMPESVNRAGMATIVAVFLFSQYVLPPLIPIKSLSAIVLTLILYPLLRLSLLRPASANTPVARRRESW
jgi:cytosine permease